MSTTKRKITTNSRVLSDLLTKYKNPFFAFCELINNSIQAKASEIIIDIDYPKKNTLSSTPIKSIKIHDNGHGVSISEFENRILEVGTTAKQDGHGIGRFGAFQIGRKIEIESVAWDDSIKNFTKVVLPINTDDFNRRGLKDIDFITSEEVLKGKRNPYYSVSIKNLHQSTQEKIARKNRISEELYPQNIRFSLFEKYPYEIFNDSVSFSVNGKKLNRSEFIHEKPIIQKVKYTDIRGVDHNLKFCFYNVKLTVPKVKVFLQVENGGIKSVAHEYTYSSDWHSPESGAWFIYVESSYFTVDLFRNIDLEDMGDEELTKLKQLIRSTVTDFFISRNTRFENFKNTLTDDESYPYREHSAASQSQEVIFHKVAFLVEEQYKLLEKDSKLKNLIYPLIDRAIADGNIVGIFDKLLKLDKKSVDKFHELLEKTELENVVHFANQVADKIEFIDFLHVLVYGDLAQVIKERSQLHKIIEKHLWLFGEAYSDTPRLWSDRKIGNILNEIRTEHLVYDPTTKDGNLIEHEGDELNEITDLFFTNEKITDDGSKEYMIVELKSPKCLIGKKEIAQIDSYAYTIEKHAGLPSDNTKYRMYLVSSRINDYAKSKMNSAFDKYHVPFLYEKKTQKDIEIYIISWADILERNKRKLGYLSKQLKVKDRSVKDKFENEYSELLNAKVRTTLTRIA